MSNQDGPTASVMTQPRKCILGVSSREDFLSIITFGAFLRSLAACGQAESPTQADASSEAGDSRTSQFLKWLIFAKFGSER